MDQLIERCCGLDVHRDTVAACVRVPGPNGKRQQEVRTFGTTAVELLAPARLAGGARGHACGDGEHGSVLEARILVLEEAFTCLLVNAAHIKQVPGLKTDVKNRSGSPNC